MLAILDSGVGGLSVWKKLKELAPSKGVLYFADSARVPYGNLTRDKIFIYAKESIDHLIDLGATSIAIACHTIATTVGPLLKHSSKIPIYDIASSSLPLLAPLTKVALIGTRATITSGYYQRALGSKMITAQACPLLVPMIESGKIDADIIKSSLDGIDRNVDALFLACTHFPLISEAIQSFLPNISLMDPAFAFAKTILPLAKEAPDEFYTTGDPAHFHECRTIFCGRENLSFPFLIKSLYSPLNS